MVFPRKPSGIIATYMIFPRRAIIAQRPAYDLLHFAFVQINARSKSRHHAPKQAPNATHIQKKPRRFSAVAAHFTKLSL
jgi:hypothetical protein